MEDVYQGLRKHDREYVAVLDGRKPVGICARGHVGFLMGSRYGFAVYSREPIRRHMLETPVVFDVDTPVEEALRRSLGREGHSFYHDAVLADTNGDYLGMISVRNLVQLQSRILLQQTEQTTRQQAALRQNHLQLQEALRELEKNHEESVRHERLRALGQMASGIAHDFNNTLTPILGYAELLLTRPDLMDNREKTLHYLRVILSAAEDAAKVVAQLRDFYRAREKDERFAPLDLNALIEQTIRLTQPRWKDQSQARGATIEVLARTQDLPPVLGLDSELRQLLTNLIFNAVDAIPRQGTIQVRTRAENGMAVLEVADDGVGMTDDTRRHCFEPFFTTKGDRGSGLGLSRAFGTVNRHGGSIGIVSAPGQGTTVIVKLPFALEEAKPTPCLHEMPSGRCLRVLAVDDAPDVLTLVADYLTSRGHVVDAVATPREALSRFRAHDYDVVVTDRSMPEMNGDQLASAIKLLRPETPVILLTGFGDFMSSAGERPPGIDAILSKPIGLRELADTAQRLASEVVEASERV